MPSRSTKKGSHAKAQAPIDPNQADDVYLSSIESLRRLFSAFARELSDNNTMPHDVIRGALEQELDLIQEKYERLFGRQAARETFARRASALSDGALDPGMAARELTEPKLEPQLSEADLAEFKAHAAANPWDKRVCSPCQHIRTTFQKWLGHGLKRKHIRDLPGTLGSAYATEIRRYPDRRVEGLIEEPRGLPAGAPRPPSSKPVVELTEDEKRERRRRDLEYKRRQQLKHM